MGGLRSLAGLLRRSPDLVRLYLALLLASVADWFATVAVVGPGGSDAEAVPLGGRGMPFTLHRRRPRPGPWERS